MPDEKTQPDAPRKKRGRPSYKGEPMTPAERKRRQRAAQIFADSTATKERFCNYLVRTGIPHFVTKSVLNGTVDSLEYREFWKRLGVDTSKEGELERVTAMFYTQERAESMRLMGDVFEKWAAGLGAPALSDKEKG